MKGFMQKKGIEKRLIALWLVFVMMLTPVITNLGGKKGTKAENDPAVTVAFDAAADTTTVGGILGISTALPTTADWIEMGTDPQTYKNKDIIYGRYKIYMKSGDTIKYSIPNATLGSTWGNKSYGYKVYENQADIMEQISASEITAFTERTSDYNVEDIQYSGTKYLVLYAREIDGSTHTGDNTLYSATDIIELVSVDSVIANSIKISNEVDPAQPGCEIKDYNNGPMYIHMPGVEATYKILKLDASGNKEFVDFDVKYVDTVNGTSGSATAINNGSYMTIAQPTGDDEIHSIKIGLYSGSGFYGSVTTTNITMTNADLTETTPPVVNSVKLCYGAGYTEISDYENDGTEPYYTTQTGNIYYAITVSDENSGIAKVKYGEGEIAAVGGVYYIPTTDFESTKNVVAFDKAGNQSTPQALRQVQILDATHKYVDVKIKTSDDVVLGEKDTDGVGTAFETTTNVYSYTNTELAINADVTIKSGLKIQQIELLTNGSTIVTRNTGINGVVNNGENYYTYSVTGLLLKDVSLCQKYDTIKVKVTYADSTSSEVTLGNLFCDSISPDKPSVKLQHWNGTTWLDHTGTYIDTTEAATNYRYLITNVNDNVNGSGFSTEYTDNVKISSSSDWSATGRTGAYSSSGDYTYTFNDDDKNAIAALTGAATYKNYILVKDKAGNVKSLDLPALKKLETGISFGKIELKDSNGIIKHFEDSNLAVNDTYKLYVTVETGYPIEKVYLRKFADGGTETEFALDNTATVYGTTANDAGRYTSTLVFKMPSTDATDNTQYNSITLYVTDNNSNNGSKTLGDLIYDNSRPRVEKLEYASGWVKESEATLTYEVVAGSQSVESVLAEASYTLAGQVTYITPAALNTTGEKTVVMPETTDPVAGTKITFDATDNAGNTITDLGGTKPFEATMFVDGHSPIVSELTVDSKNTFTAPLGGIPTISTSYTDNLALGKVDVTVTYPNGVSKVYTKSYDEYNGIGVNVSDSYSFQVDAVNGKAADGNYNISVVAYDKAGNKSVTNTIAFTVDNTLPVVNLAISGGTKGGKQPRADGTDYYYSSNVPVSLEVEETNFTLSGVTVTDKVGNGNAKPVTVTWSKLGDKYVASMSSTSEGHHVVTISAKDATGNTAVSKSVNFCIDKSDPGISLTLNGLAYQESRGTVDLTSDAAVSASVTDMTEDKGDFNIQIIQTKPDQTTTAPAYVKTGSRSFGFSEEADYTVNLFAVDMANNKSAVRTISFRVDKTAPDLTISGAAGGGTSANAATVTFTMKEAFWWDAGGQVTIYKKAGDGKEEALLKTIDVKPTAFETSVSETLADTGVYRFEFTGYDRVGHRVETTQSFTIDRDAPVVTLAGVANYDMTTENVLFQAEIMDDFYASKSVSVTGTVTDINGKVEKLTFNPYTTVANPTVITQEFADDGIYDIEVSSTDAAGNSHSSKVHFVIDKTAPEIGDLSAFDGTILKSFVWDIDLDDLVSDLTVCDTHMYLNGSEYDGVSDIEDGSYTLLITAEDELGHMVEKSVSFILDTKAPVFIVTGVEDGEAKLEPYDISVSLQLDEDTLTSVTLNGEAIEIVDNAASLNVSENGHYKLAMKAVDEAGNEADQTISFTVGEEKKAGSWWVWLIIACGVVLVGAGIIIAVRKNSKEA